MAAKFRRPSGAVQEDAEHGSDDSSGGSVHTSVTESGAHRVVPVQALVYGGDSGGRGRLVQHLEFFALLAGVIAVPLYFYSLQRTDSAELAKDLKSSTVELKTSVEALGTKVDGRCTELASSIAKLDSRVSGIDATVQLMKESYSDVTEVARKGQTVLADAQQSINILSATLKQQSNIIQDFQKSADKLSSSLARIDALADHIADLSSQQQQGDALAKDFSDKLRLVARSLAVVYRNQGWEIPPDLLALTKNGA